MSATTEYLIQGNQIVARDTFTRPVTNVADVIKELNSLSNYIFSQVKIPPLMSKWTKAHYLGVDSNSGIQLLISEVEYFPLPNAYVRSDGKLSFNYTEEDTPETKKPLVSQKWEFPSQYRVFIVQFADPNYAESPLSVQKPILFLWKNHSLPLIPKFPNLYGCGNICTGSSYRKRTVNMQNDLLQAFKIGLDVIHTATPNFDLNESSIRNYMIYNNMQDQERTDPDNNSMYRSATKYTIMEVCKWIMKNKI